MNRCNRDGDCSQLPEGWEWRTLADVASIQSGQAVPSSTYTDDESGLLFLQGNAEFGDLRPTPIKRTNAPKVITDERSVLISVRAPVGATNLSPGRVGIGRGLAAITPGDALDQRFLLWALRNSRTVLQRQATGTTFPAITGKVLASHQLPLPPLKEQAEIVTRVEQVDERLNAGMRRLDEAHRQLRAFRAASHSSAFSGGSRVLARSGEERLDSVATIQSGIAKGRPGEGPLSEVPYLRTANVQAGFLDLNEVKLIAVTPPQRARHLLRDGDVLVLEGGDADKVGRGWLWEGQIAECLHQNHVFAVRPGDRLRPRFLAHYINAPSARAYFLSVANQTTNLASINKRNLKGLPVPIFSLADQDLLVGELDRRLASADRMSGAIEAAKLGLADVRRSVLHQAFRGKLKGLDGLFAAA
jgi:type I restriction enzyme, S subunit